MRLYLSKNDDLFYFDTDNSLESERARRAGLAWDRQTYKWVTPFVDIAERLAPFLSNITDAYPLIEKQKRNLARTRLLSEAVSSDIEVDTPPGLKLKPFQKAGVEFLLHKKRVLLADEMGLGKTPQTVCAVNALKNTQKVLIVCPANLKTMWLREWKKWTTLNLSAGITNPNSSLSNIDVVIINYDILSKLSAELNQTLWSVLILDEVHYLKNNKAKRTLEIFGGRTKKGLFKPLRADRVFALTGTPVLNRPIELYPVLHYLDPIAWPRKHDFALRYCNARKTDYGWDYSGSSNLEDLQERLRSTVMIRRLKRNVLKDLPPKVRQIIEINPKSGVKKILKQESSFWERFVSVKKDILSDSEFESVIKTLNSEKEIEFSELSRIRRELAEERAPYIIEHLQNCIESGQKVVCFCHHRVLIEKIREAFKGVSVALYGGTTNKQDLETKFQNDNRIRLFIGSIKAAGVGLTLTASSHVVFAEHDWVPGNITQAEDRTHRITQLNSVLVQHIVFTDSFDAAMTKTIVRKQEIIDRALNTNSFYFLN